MVELIIEHWSHRNGTDEFLWSVWDQGKRVGMGGAGASVETAEREGIAWCKRTLGIVPDRVTRL